MGSSNGETNREFDRLLFKKREGKVSSVHLNSPGGLVDEGYAFGREIQDQELTTIVERSAHCESACFLIFIAGARKIASAEARIGLHRGNLNGVDNEEVTQDVINHVFKLGNIDESTFREIAFNIHKTHASRMTYIPIQALQNMGVEVRP